MCHVCNLVFSLNILYMFDVMNTCSRNFFSNSDTNLEKLSKSCECCENILHIFSLGKFPEKKKAYGVKESIIVLDKFMCWLPDM